MPANLWNPQQQEEDDPFKNGPLAGGQNGQNLGGGNAWGPAPPTGHGDPFAPPAHGDPFAGGPNAFTGNGLNLAGGGSAQSPMHPMGGGAAPPVGAPDAGPAMFGDPRRGGPFDAGGAAPPVGVPDVPMVGDPRRGVGGPFDAGGAAPPVGVPDVPLVGDPRRGVGANPPGGEMPGSPFDDPLRREGGFGGGGDMGGGANPPGFGGAFGGGFVGRGPNGMPMMSAGANGSPLASGGDPGFAGDPFASRGPDGQPMAGSNGLDLGAMSGTGGVAGESGPAQVSQTPQAGQPQADAGGYKPPFLLGFDTNKLMDPNKGPGDSGKYTAAAKAFGQSYLGGTSISRGNLGGMIDKVKAQFPNARAVGDDKIDFGDGLGPIDVIGSDGTVRFQNTTDNDRYMASRGGAGSGGANPGIDPHTGQPIGGGGYALAGGAFSGGGGGGGGTTVRPTYTGEDFKYTPIQGADTYNPQAIQGPDAFTPAEIRAQQVKGPAAIGANAFGGVTAADMAADPGYQFRLKESLGALQSSAAAKGALRSGNTLDAVAARAGQMASDEFGNVYARKFGEHTFGEQNRMAAYDLSNRYDQGAQLANQNANLSAADRNASNSLAAWQAYQGMNQNTRQFNAARTDTANQQNFANRFSVDQANNANRLAAWQGNVNAKLGFGNLDLGYTRAGNDFSLGQGQLALGNKTADQSFYLGNRNADIGMFSASNSAANAAGQLGLGWARYGLDSQGQDFNQGFSLSQLGLQAAGMQAGYGGQYAGNAGQYYTGAGNAAAAGRVGSQNAWNQGFTGAANSAMGAYTAYQKKKDNG